MSSRLLRRGSLSLLFPLVRAALGVDPPAGLRVLLDVFSTRPAHAQELMQSTGEER